MRAKNLAMVGTTVGAIILGLVVQPGGSASRMTGSRVRLGHSMTPLQVRLLSGGTQQALVAIGARSVLAAGFPTGGSDDPPILTPDLAAGGPIAGAGIAGGPANVTAGPDGLCRLALGSNIRVNTDCQNASDPAFHGRGQAQNETAIAANPQNPNQLIAEQNDYRFGDGSCGADFSVDGGRTWGNSLVPTKFATDPSTHLREYWQGSGDPAVAWDSSGTAYFECMAFNRGTPPVGPTNNPDTNSVIYVFRSDNKGASFNFPGSRGGPGSGANGQVTYQVGSPTTGVPLADKPYMAIDANASSPFRDYIYVSWTLFDADGTVKIYLNRSRNHGESWDGNVLLSTPSSLCPVSVIGTGNCDANTDSVPVVASNGDLYVVWNNYNNAVSGNDNRNQILMAKSTDGGTTFSPVIKVADFYDLPSCVVYTGQDFGRACVPVKAPATVASQPSVFRAVNYPSAIVDPRNPKKVTVFFGSYINRNSNESNGCVPTGFGPDGNNAFTGVNTPSACNNDIVVSTSSDGGFTWTGQTKDPRVLRSLSPAGDRTDQWWQWAAALPDGTAAVSYYDRAYGSDEATGFSDITASIGGERQRVTSSSMPSPTEFPNGAGHSLFFGDYSGLTVAGETVIPFWSDSRDVGVTSCPADPRKLCSFGNDEDVFIARVTGDGGGGGGGNGGGGGD